MTTLALPWFEDEDPRDLRRWAMAAAIVVAIHIAAFASYAYLHLPDEIGDDTSAVSVDLEPIDSTDTANQQDIAPAPEEMIEQKTTPQPETPPDQPAVEQPPPPDTTADVALPETKPPEPIEEKQPPAPRTTAQVKGGAPRVLPSWQTGLIRHLQQYKRYPSDAQSRGEEGVVLLSFSVDRDGHVLAHRIVRSSGHPELDEEVMSMIERAEPLPPFPPTMTDAKLDLTVPIRFSLR
jgi:protein TonB